MKAFSKVTVAANMAFAVAISFFGCSSDDGEDNNNPGVGVSSSSDVATGGSSPSVGVSDGGTITITDIPAEYNGKYAFFNTDARPAPAIIGAADYNISTRTASLVQISNGSVSLPLWTFNETDELVRYSGNLKHGDNGFVISSESTFSFSNSNSNITVFLFCPVTYSNGNATISFSEGTPKEQEHLLYNCPRNY